MYVCVLEMAFIIALFQLSHHLEYVIKEQYILIHKQFRILVHKCGTNGVMDCMAIKVIVT